MKIMTWNVRCQNAGDDARGCGWSVRRQPLCAIVREQAPDIWATQEAYAPQIDDLCAALPAYQMAGVGRNDGARAGEFCAIFWRAERYQLREQQTLWLSPTPDEPSFGWGAHCVRICTRARLFDHQTGANSRFGTHTSITTVRSRASKARASCNATSRN